MTADSFKKNFWPNIWGNAAEMIRESTLKVTMTGKKRIYEYCDWGTNSKILLKQNRFSHNSEWDLISKHLL